MSREKRTTCSLSRVQNNFVFKKKSSDHSAVYITLDNKRGVSGSERNTIDEELTLKPEVQQEIMVAMNRIYTMNPHKSEVNKWTETQAEITDILKKHTAANKRQTKSEIRVVEAKLAALNRNHKLLGAKPAGLKLEQKYQRTLYELQHPEVLREPSIKEARSMYEKSEVCTRAMFSTYKSRANQQWINAVKKSDWTEGVEPDFQGTTTKVSEVGGEFVKLYKMIFAEKEIAGEEWLLEGLKEHRLVKSSRQMLDEPFTVNEVAEVMQNLTI